MLTNVYSRAISVLVLGLVVVIIGLSLVLVNNGPRVRLVGFARDVSESALMDGSNITIRFDRPIADGDYSDQVKFEPNVDFAVRAAPQALVITLESNMQSNTKYKITVGPNVHDSSGRMMDQEHVYEFTTGQPRIAYLERNYGYGSDTSDAFTGTDALDHIKVARVGGETETLFSAPQITMFAANSNYVVVAVHDDRNDRLYTVDLGSGHIREENLPLRGQINNLALSPRGRTALYTVTPDLNEVGQDQYRELASRLESLDLDTGDVSQLSDGEGHIQAYYIEFDVDGQVALIQDPSLSFYAVSPFGDFDPVPLGSYASSLGFGQPGQALFIGDSGIVRHDFASGSATEVGIDPGGATQSVDVRGSDIVTSSTYFSSNSNSFVKKFNDWNDQDPEIIWRSSLNGGLPLRGFKLSYGGEMLALQLGDSNCEYDQVVPNTECKDSRIVVYDHAEGKTIFDTPGLDLVWLP